MKNCPKEMLFCAAYGTEQNELMVSIFYHMLLPYLFINRHIYLSNRV